jgi:hypothetical protein
MKRTRTHPTALLAVAICAALPLLSLLIAAPRPAGAQGEGQGQSQVERGYAISPVPLNLKGKNPALVGLGSFIINAQRDSTASHTWPNFKPGGNPYLGQPEQINTDRYLAGGRPFVPPGVVSRNLTPDANGLPAGLTLAEFIEVIRTGHDPDNPGRLLLVMPWPVFRNMSDRELAAVYEYLRCIPSIR